MRNFFKAHDTVFLPASKSVLTVAHRGGSKRRCNSTGDQATRTPHCIDARARLPERLSCREHWRPQYEFCQGLSLGPRGHAFVRDGEWWNVKCFALREDAERFIERFGGEYMTPATRPR